MTNLRSGQGRCQTAGPGGTVKVPATLIPGDGIGPEIIVSVRDVLEALGDPFEWDEQIAGKTALEKAGSLLPDATMDSVRRTKLVLKGPLTTPAGEGFRSVNVQMRETFELYANVRPALTVIPDGRYDKIDIVLIRENLNGYYAAFEHYLPVANDPEAVAIATGFNTRAECERIIRFAFEYALKKGRKKVTLVHKANILKLISGIFLKVGREIAKDYEGRVAVDERIVDATAMLLVTDPWQFDVIVTTNLFGDILSDLTAGLIGGLGLAPGINIGTDSAMFEAVHGSAPDIAGKGVANPLALMLAAVEMLEHVGKKIDGDRLRQAIRQALVDDGVRTHDLGGKASTADVTAAVKRRLAASGSRQARPKSSSRLELTAS